MKIPQVGKLAFRVKPKPMYSLTRQAMPLILPLYI